MIPIRKMLAIACLMAATAGAARATLLTWQSSVNASSPAATLFTTVSGASPQMFNVGTLSGDRSFEFIYNASPGSPSQALMGSNQAGSGNQGLKLNQWDNTGKYGLTAFGVADYTSTTNSVYSQNAHVVYSSNGTNTILYVNGVAAYTFTGVALGSTGMNALGAQINANAVYNDNLQGNILGFASYDTALSATDVAAHYAAFQAVPEPGVAGLSLLAGLGLLTGRRRR